MILGQQRVAPVTLSSLACRFQDERGNPRPTSPGNRLFAFVISGDPSVISSINDDQAGTWSRVTETTWSGPGLTGGVVDVTINIAGSPDLEVVVAEVANRAV